MADLQACDPRGEAFDEGIVDGALQEQTARGGAALPIQAVDHEHNGIQGALQIRVLEHEHGVLAAELQMHALQSRGALTHDEAAGP